jgi:uncharacterized protein YndB with AHSA1/START domain
MPRTATRTIRLQVFIHRPPKKVFEAISDPDLLARWFVDTASLPQRKGGSYTFGWTDGPTHSGKVVDFARGRYLTLAWTWPGREQLGSTRLRMSVEPKAGGTVVKFIHSGFKTRGPWVDLYDGAIRGWTYFLMNLKSVLEFGHDLRSPHDW